MEKNNVDANIRRNIWKFFLISALSSAWFIMPISILYLQSFGLNFLEIGLLYGISSIVVIIFIVPAGALVDLIGKKFSSFIGGILWSLGLFIIGMGSDFYVFLIGYIFFYGLSEVMFTSAYTALLYETLARTDEEQKYLKINSKILLISSIVLIISSFSGVFLYTLNKRLPFLLFSFLVLVSSILIIFMKEPYEIQKDFTIKNQFQQMKKGLKESILNKKLRSLVICSVLFSIPISIFLTLMEQPYLISLGFNLATIGLIFAVTRGTIGILSSLIPPIEKRLGERNSMYLVIIIYSAAFVLIGLINSPLVIFVLVGLIFTREYKTAAISKYVNENTYSSQRATIFSIQNFYINIFYSIALIIVGALLTMLAMSLILIIMGVSTFMIALPYVKSSYSE